MSLIAGNAKGQHCTEKLSTLLIDIPHRRASVCM